MHEISSLNTILRSFKIRADCLNYRKMDNYFFYDIKLHPGAKVKDVTRYLDEISLSLKVQVQPHAKVLYESGVIRLEFISPRSHRFDLFNYFSNDYVPQGEVICLLGQKLDGSPVWMDLGQNPHMIVSGTTGSGKSTLLHNIIGNLFNYNKVILYLLDPKNIEFSEYDKRIKNSDLTVGYSYQEGIDVLDHLLEMMEERYTYLRENGDLIGFSPIVLIIDEFADLILQDKDNSFYTKLCRLAQKCRAAKIFIILATQRPSVNIINGTIKANFPARIACKVSSHIDSKVILDATGAENLLGQGDALLRNSTHYLDRFQIAYTNATEVCNIFA